MKPPEPCWTTAAHAGFRLAALDPSHLRQLGHRLSHARRRGVTQALGKEKGVLLPFEFQKPRPLWDQKGLWLKRFGRKPGGQSKTPTDPSRTARGRLSRGVDGNLKAVVRGLWKRAYSHLRVKPWEVHGDDGRGTLFPVSQGNP